MLRETAFRRCPIGTTTLLSCRISLSSAHEGIVRNQCRSLQETKARGSHGSAGLAGSSQQPISVHGESQKVGKANGTSVSSPYRSASEHRLRATREPRTRLLRDCAGGTVSATDPKLFSVLYGPAFGSVAAPRQTARPHSAHPTTATPGLNLPGAVALTNFRAPSAIIPKLADISVSVVASSGGGSAPPPGKNRSPSAKAAKTTKTSTATAADSSSTTSSSPTLSSTTFDRGTSPNRSDHYRESNPFVDATSAYTWCQSEPTGDDTPRKVKEKPKDPALLKVSKADSMELASAADRLKSDLPDVFSDSRHFDMISDDVILENHMLPVRYTTQGVSVYRIHASALQAKWRVLCRDQEFHLLSCEKVPEDSAVVVRWKIVGAPRWLPGKMNTRDRMKCLDGVSTFEINGLGQVHRHKVSKVRRDNERHPLRAIPVMGILALGMAGLKKHVCDHFSRR